MAQWHPHRLAICSVAIILAGLLVLSPTVAAAQPAYRYQQQSAEASRPPSLMLSVYRWATESAVAGCELPSGLLAAVGDVTSGHGQRGSVAATDTTDASGPHLSDDGTLRPGLFGAPISDDTDGGLWDADQIHDRPVGPFQFTPATWDDYGVDVNGDGIADPQNAWDAAAAAADFLCRHGAGEPEQLDAALIIYFGGEPNAMTARQKMSGYGSVTGRNTVGEPSQLGTYWTDDTGAYLDRWNDHTLARTATPQTISAGPSNMVWLVGDWNGDGATTPASYEPNPEGLGTFRFFDNAGAVTGEPLLFGAPSSVPLVGDWNADGVDEIGTFVMAGNEGIFLLGSGTIVTDEPDGPNESAKTNETVRPATRRSIRTSGRPSGHRRLGWRRLRRPWRLPPQHQHVPSCRSTRTTSRSARRHQHDWQDQRTSARSSQ